MKRNFTLLMILLGTCGLVAQDLKLGLEQYWSFNDSLDGHFGNEMIVSNGVEIKDDSVFHQAAHFTTPGSFVQYKHGINFFNYFTLAFWMKPVKTNDLQIIFTQKNNKREFTLQKKKDEIKFILQDEFGYKYQANTRHAFADGKWYFLCIVMEGTQCNVFINNKLALNADRIKMNIRNLQTNDTLFVGSSLQKQYSYRGALDEIMVYNRPLTGLEMDRLFAKHFPDFSVPVITDEIIKDPIYNRQVIIERSLEVTQPKVIIEYWDDEKQDDDIISLIFNDEKIVSDYKLTLRKQELILNVKPGYHNRLVLIAENLGTIPPNTAKVKVTCGKVEEELRLKSDLEKSAAIEFIYNKVGSRNE